MDEDDLFEEESSESIKKTEREIDEFLFSIRENVFKNPTEDSKVLSNINSVSSSDFDDNLSLPSNENKGKQRKESLDPHNQGNTFEKQCTRTRKRRTAQRRTLDKMYRKPSSQGKEDYLHMYSPTRDEEEYDESFPFDDEVYYNDDDSEDLHHERDLNSSEDRHDDLEEKLLSWRRRGSKDRNPSHPREEYSHESYNFDEDFRGDRPSSSRSSDFQSKHSRIYAEEHKSPSYWSESQESDYENELSKGEDNTFVNEDDDNWSWSSDPMDTTSLITVCLKKVISNNPGIAEKVSEACASFLNKSLNKTYSSDYECEENPPDNFVDESCQDPLRGWRSSRSPSFSNSQSSFSESTRRHFKNRSVDRYMKRKYSPSKDETTSTAVTSRKYDGKKRFFNKRHKRDHEVDVKSYIRNSIRQIRTECEEEKDSTVRRALLALLEVHERECQIYIRKPETLPDYNKKYQKFLEKKSKGSQKLWKSSEDDFQQEWNKYLQAQMSIFFKESWDAKKQKCTDILQRKGHLCKSLNPTSRKNTIKASESKKNTSEGPSENMNRGKYTEEEGQKERIDIEILSVLKLLRHLKHRFKDFESTFDSFFETFMNLKQKTLDSSGLLCKNIPLFEKIEAVLKDTLKEESLSFVQKAIIKETYERFTEVFHKIKRLNSFIKENKDDTQDKTMEVMEKYEDSGFNRETSTSSSAIYDTKSSSTEEYKISTVTRTHYTKELKPLPSPTRKNLIYTSEIKTKENDSDNTQPSPPDESTPPPPSPSNVKLLCTVPESSSIPVSSNIAPESTISIPSSAATVDSQAASFTSHTLTKQTSTTSTSTVQNEDKKVVAAPRVKKVQVNKELLRSTIKDCFLSTTSSNEGKNADKAKEEPISNKPLLEELVSSASTLSEDILKMFVVKPEEKKVNDVLPDKKECTNSTESEVKPVAKKPIKIIIPQFAKQGVANDYFDS